MKKYVADFETSTWKEDETWVWAWAVGDIDYPESIVTGNNIDSFMDFLYYNRGAKIYFHNLAFDGEFLIYWLLKNGFEHVKHITDVKNNTFITLISDMRYFL